MYVSLGVEDIFITTKEKKRVVANQGRRRVHMGVLGAEALDKLGRKGHA